MCCLAEVQEKLGGVKSRAVNNEISLYHRSSYIGKAHLRSTYEVMASMAAMNVRLFTKRIVNKRCRTHGGSATLLAQADALPLNLFM